MPAFENITETQDIPTSIFDNQEQFDDLPLFEKPVQDFLPVDTNDEFQDLSTDNILEQDEFGDLPQPFENHTVDNEPIQTDILPESHVDEFGDLPQPFEKQTIDNTPIQTNEYIESQVDEFGDLPQPFEQKIQTEENVETQVDEFGDLPQPFERQTIDNVPIQTSKLVESQVDEFGDLPQPFERQTIDNTPIQTVESQMNKFGDLPQRFERQTVDNKSIQIDEFGDLPKPFEKHTIDNVPIQTNLPIKTSILPTEKLSNINYTIPTNIPVFYELPNPFRQSNDILKSIPTIKLEKPIKEKPIKLYEKQNSTLVNEHFPDIPAPFKIKSGGNILLSQLYRDVNKIKSDCNHYSRLLNRYIEMYPDGIEFKHKFSKHEIENMIQQLDPKQCQKNKYPIIINWLKKQID